MTPTAFLLHRGQGARTRLVGRSGRFDVRLCAALTTRLTAATWSAREARAVSSVRCLSVAL